METKFTKGEWRQRRLLSEPLLIRSEDTGDEWYHNEINIVDNTGRVICDVDYNTISPNEGWGHNDTIEKWEANAKLIAAAPEMFEALKSIYNDPETFNDMFGSQQDKIKSALKKATE